LFKDRVLRGTFGTKREDVTGGTERLHQLHCSTNIIRIIETKREGERERSGMRHAAAIYETHTF
jgi:hypothetical protein